MPFALVQAGTALKVVDPSGTSSTPSLPSGVSLATDKVPRMATVERGVVIANTPTQNLFYDPLLDEIRPFAPLPPVSAPVLAAGSATGLTGDYYGAVSFLIKDTETGAVLSESGLSPISNTVALTDDKVSWTGIPVSNQSAVNARRLYRTAAGGEVLYIITDLDGNTATTFTEAISDASIALAGIAPTLGSPPGSAPGSTLRLLVAWKKRLWGASSDIDDLDTIYISEAEPRVYAWGTDRLVASPRGEDRTGIVQYAPRRDNLVCLKRNRLLAISGTTTADFSVQTISEEVGCLAPDSVVVIRDTVYWLWDDGVYAYDDRGVRCISDGSLGKGKVDPWFTTDTYFNRSRFPNARAGYNPLTRCYELHLANAGDSTENRWVSYSIETGEWLGIHRTSAATPVCRMLLQGSDNSIRPTVGASDGYLYLMNQATKSDVAGSTSAISFAVKTRPHAGIGGGDPDIMHYFGELSMFAEVESGGTLTITPYIGWLNASAGTTLSMTLSNGRERLGRLGVGELCQLEFTSATAGQDVLLYGYAIDPIHEVGRR